MRIEAFDSFGKPIKVNATRVVVYDDQDNPIIAALKWSHNNCFASRQGDKDFERLLKLLGIDKTVILDVIKTDDENTPANRILI